MDHAEAIHIQAPSRYLQGELSPSEARAFEEHFFGCPDCAEEVSLENTFEENIRAVFQDEDWERSRGAAVRPVLGSKSIPGSIAGSSPGLWERLRLAWTMPLAALACLLAAVGIQNV